MSGLRAVVFDFDGTLAELVLDFDAMRRRLERLAAGYLPDPRADAQPVLEWLEATRAVLAARSAADADAFAERAGALVRGMELEAARQGRLFPFARGVLEELRGRGVATAVVTRNCADAVLAVFPDLEACCGAVLAREHVERVKPHPAHLLRALELLGVAPEQAAMVGDHPLDVQTGLAAGTLACGVASGRINEQALRDAGAHHTAPDCPTLLALLRQRNLL
jgi:phosphoglycolate phosphatase